MPKTRLLPSLKYVFGKIVPLVSVDFISWVFSAYTA
jgi:hypothetical protein